MNDHFISFSVPYIKLELRVAFERLQDSEKWYMYHLSKASWAGAQICLFQLSYESPLIFQFLHRWFAVGIAKIQEVANAMEDVASLEFQALLTYTAAFYSNLGNYHSFGDSKFIPEINAEALQKLVDGDWTENQLEKQQIQDLFTECKEAMYSVTPREKILGFRPDATTNYYGNGVTKNDAEIVQKFLSAQKIPAWNTRIRLNTEKQNENSNERYLEIWSAAATVNASSAFTAYEGVFLRIVTGDYSAIMEEVNEHLKQALPYANPDQSNMIQKYIDSFTSGSIEDHKEASIIWVGDKSPPVESYIGFIETYRDPLGVRAEWEGFVAAVNRDESLKFDKLVEGSEALLSKLPWPTTFEKDVFLRPDFTSLDVVAFASSGIPAGINIPNYDEIRQNHGFKNVSLGNVLSASLKQNEVTFLGKEDEELFKEYAAASFQVQVGLHELLGHGSGKLFEQSETGTHNFDVNTVRIPSLSDDNGVEQPVTTWYMPGETWDSKFPVFGSSYEECRAECVGIYLCLEEEALSIFGHSGQAAQDVVYINWLMMARAGLVALEVYRPETSSWGQAHMQARFVILQVLLEIGEGFVSIERRDPGGLRITLDRTKIESHGKPAIGLFLQKLQIFKSTANYKAGKELYDKYSSVSEEFIAFRELVLEYKKPRRIMVQPHLTMAKEGASITLNDSFTLDAGGMIESFQQRFPVDQLGSSASWKAEVAAFAP